MEPAPPHLLHPRAAASGGEHGFGGGRRPQADGWGHPPHGCGEYFPLDPSLEKLDGAPSDGERDLTDRRVEVFFFDGKLGVQPPVPGESSKRGSAEYPEWRARAKLVREHSVELDRRIPVRFFDRLGKVFRDTWYRYQGGSLGVPTR